jgi:hypothetical protein
MFGLGISESYVPVAQGLRDQLERLADSCPQCSNEIRRTSLVVTESQYRRHRGEWHTDQIRDLVLLPSVGAA